MNPGQGRDLVSAPFGASTLKQTMSSVPEVTTAVASCFGDDENVSVRLATPRTLRLNFQVQFPDPPPGTATSADFESVSLYVFFLKRTRKYKLLRAVSRHSCNPSFPLKARHIVCLLAGIIRLLFRCSIRRAGPIFPFERRLLITDVLTRKNDVCCAIRGSTRAGIAAVADKRLPERPRGRKSRMAPKDRRVRGAGRRDNNEIQSNWQIKKCTTKNHETTVTYDAL